VASQKGQPSRPQGLDELKSNQLGPLEKLFKSWYCDFLLPMIEIAYFHLMMEAELVSKMLCGF
jgi:hypothetical protein